MKSVLPVTANFSTLRPQTFVLKENTPGTISTELEAVTTPGHLSSSCQWINQLRKSYNIGRSNCHQSPWGVRGIATQWSKRGLYPGTWGFLEEAFLNASIPFDNSEQVTTGNMTSQGHKVKGDLSVKTWATL